VATDLTGRGSIAKRQEVKHMIIAILAWSGAALSCLLTIPQAVRTVRTDRVDGISTTTYWIVLGNAITWAAWSLLTEQYAAGVPALVNGPAAVVILLRLHRSDRRAATRARGPRGVLQPAPLRWTAAGSLVNEPCA
jgi:uncharacterized protein with PQ loop repeat